MKKTSVDRWRLSEKDFKDVSDDERSDFLLQKVRAHEITDEEYLHWGGTENPYETTLFGFEKTTKNQHAMFQKMKTWHEERSKLLKLRDAELLLIEGNEKIKQDIEKQRDAFFKKHSIKTPSDLMAKKNTAEFINMSTVYNRTLIAIETSRELIERWSRQIDMSFEHADEYRRRVAREHMAEVDGKLQKSSDFLGKSFRQMQKQEEVARDAEFKTEAIGEMRTQARPYRKEKTTDFMDMMVAGLSTTQPTVAKTKPVAMKFL